MSEHLKDNRVVRLDSLIPHPRNFRTHPDEQVRDLILSLQRFGQGRSIVIQDAPQKQLIVAGHGIVEAAKALEWEELRADILPASWTPEQITGYLVADNLHSQKASDDDELLATLLQEQQNAGYDLASMGSDDETLRQMLEALGDELLEREITPNERLDKNQEESLDVYNSHTIRQIVLLLSIPEFASLLARFKQIRERESDLETNTDVVKFLVEYYAEREELPSTEGVFSVPAEEEE